MAILRVNCGLDGCADLRAFDGAALAADPVGVAVAGPTVALIHGYRYDPAVACADPHRSLYAAGGDGAAWPRGLGLEGATGLCVAFGWRARARILQPLLREGRNGFAGVYAAAAQAGAARVGALEAAARARPQPVDILAHSLGARVALSALRAAAEAGRVDLLARIGRVVLMGPAEFGEQARTALAACDRAGAPTPEVYCLTARGNAPFDRLFEALAPWGQGPSLGREGLGARRVGWIDLAFDDPRFGPWAAGLGAPLAPAGLGPCHWSFYARGGAMALHRAIFERAPGTGVEAMRASGAPLLAPRARRALIPRGPTLPPAALPA